MSAVLHYMQRWLPLSEQFVHTLVTRSRHKGIVVSREKAENRGAFPHRPVYSVARLMATRRPPTVAERRFITAYLMTVALGHRVRLVHQHHAYRIPDIHGVVKRLGLPLVVSAHGHDVAAFAREWPGHVESALSLAAAVIVPSRFLVDAVGALGAPADRIHVMPSGVDTSFFRPTPLPDGSREALFVGRFVEKKGIDVLLRAWGDVERRVPGARLRLLGFGPLEALARSGGPAVTVEPADPARRAEQVREAIRRARVVVTPSRTASDGDVETLLLVNLEAQASGRPLVSTRHGGIPEFVDEGRTALLVPENDAPSLADALVKALTDDDLAGRLAAAGPEWARRFDWDSSMERINRLYDSLIA